MSRLRFKAEFEAGAVDTGLGSADMAAAAPTAPKPTPAAVAREPKDPNAGRAGAGAAATGGGAEGGAARWTGAAGVGAAADLEPPKEPKLGDGLLGAGDGVYDGRLGAEYDRLDELEDDPLPRIC